MKRIALYVIALALCIGTLAGCGRKDRVLTTWNIYKGEIHEFTVEIEDVGHDSKGQLERIMHLRPTLDNSIWNGETASYLGITGHDYDGDGYWDRVFYCGYPNNANGCNSVMVKWNHDITGWEPCPADKGKIQKFNQEEVDRALRYLSTAMVEIHNSTHLVSTLEQYRAKDVLDKS